MENGFRNKFKRLLKTVPFVATVLSPSDLSRPIEAINGNSVQENLDNLNLSLERKNKIISYEDFIEKGDWQKDKESLEENILSLVRITKWAEEDVKDAELRGDKIEEIKSLKETLANIQKNLLEYQNNYKKIQENPSEELYKELLNDFKEAYERYDKQQTWLRDIVSSPAYKSRMEKEIGDSNAGDFLLKKRLERIDDKDYNLIEGYEVEGGAGGHFLLDKDLVELPTQTIEDPTSALHEFTHDMTEGDYWISRKARELYTESFTDKNFTESERRTEDEYLMQYDQSYFNRTTERDARKKQLEYDLEKFGIKKYGEEFNDSHYEKILELQKAGKLSHGADQFVRMTEPEFFKKIMNEIASNSKRDFIWDTDIT